MTVVLFRSVETDTVTCNDKKKHFRCSNTCNSGLNEKFSQLCRKRANLRLCVDICSQIFQQQLCCKSSCSKLSGDRVAHQAHILNYVFLCGLDPNLINCENVVGGMSQLSVAPQSIPEESPSVLSLSAFPSALTTLELPKILFGGLFYCYFSYGLVFLPAVCFNLAAKYKVNVDRALRGNGQFLSVCSDIH